MAIFVIDDSKESRETMVDVLSSIEVTAKAITQPGKTLPEQINQFTENDMLISDFRLKTHTYASFNGDELIAKAYKNKIPGILCSSYVDTESIISKQIKRFIPQFVNTEDFLQDLNSPEIINAYQESIMNEFKGIFTAERKPWRALVRTDSYDKNTESVYIIVPSWSTEKKIKIPLSEFPQSLRGKVKDHHVRFHAVVNLGCEDDNTLYICEIEE